MSATEEPDVKTIVVYKSYTPQQKECIYRWREKNKEHIKEYSKNLRQKQFAADPEAYRGKRAKAQRNFYAKQKLKKQQAQQQNQEVNVPGQEA
jgi:hypothetical protein